MANGGISAVHIFNSGKETQGGCLLLGILVVHGTIFGQATWQHTHGNYFSHEHGFFAPDLFCKELLTPCALICKTCTADLAYSDSAGKVENFHLTYATEPQNLLKITTT